LSVQGRGGDWCEKRHFLSHLHIKTNILPRQAQDKHRESTQKRVAFCCSGRLCARLDAGGAGRAVARMRLVVVRTFFEFSLCLSRACLGKTMHFIYKWLKKYLPFSALSLVLGLSRACLGKVIILLFESGKPLHTYISICVCVC
jgi:hypothetical protein